MTGAVTLAAKLAILVSYLTICHVAHAAAASEGDRAMTDIAGLKSGAKACSPPLAPPQPAIRRRLQDTQTGVVGSSSPPPPPLHGAATPLPTAPSSPSPVSPAESSSSAASLNTASPSLPAPAALGALQLPGTTNGSSVQTSGSISQGGSLTATSDTSPFSGSSTNRNFSLAAGTVIIAVAAVFLAVIATVWCVRKQRPATTSLEIPEYDMSQSKDGTTPELVLIVTHDMPEPTPTSTILDTHKPKPKVVAEQPLLEDFKPLPPITVRSASTTRGNITPEGRRSGSRSRSRSFQSASGSGSTLSTGSSNTLPSIEEVRTAAGIGNTADGMLIFTLPMPDPGMLSQQVSSNPSSSSSIGKRDRPRAVSAPVPDVIMNYNTASDVARSSQESGIAEANAAQRQGSAPPAAGAGRSGSGGRDLTALIREHKLSTLMIPWGDIQVTEQDAKGQGAFSRVMMGTWQGNIKVAVKPLAPASLTGVALDALREVVMELRDMHYPCVAPVYGLTNTGTHYAVVMKYFSRGSVAYALAKTDYDRHMTPYKRLDLALQVAQAMQRLHTHHPAPFVHGDLKPDNILIADDNRSVMIAHGGLTDCLSTRPKQHTTADDIFAFGFVLLEIMLGRGERDKLWNSPAAQKTTEAGPMTLTTVVNTTGLSYDVEQIMRACLAPVPASRPSFAVLAQRLQEARDYRRLDDFVHSAVNKSGRSVA